MSDAFPEGYSDLQPLADWALPTEAERSQRRRDSTLAELQAFYQTMMPRLPQLLDYLNGFALDDLPARERRLLHLSFAFAEISPFVEQYHRVVLPLNFDERRFTPMHDDPGNR